MKKLIVLFIAVLISISSSNIVFAYSDINGHWAESDIIAMTNKGAVEGYPDDKFRPEQSVKRSEFLKIISLYYGLTENENSYMIWNDVEPDIWYSKFSGAGLLMPVYDNGNLYPDHAIERYEAAYALMNIYNIELDYNSTSSSQMSDYDLYSNDDNVSAIVSTSIDNGIMKGKGSDFAPYDFLTRAQLCTLLNRMSIENADTELVNVLINNYISSHIDND